VFKKFSKRMQGFSFNQIAFEDTEIQPWLWLLSMPSIFALGRIERRLDTPGSPEFAFLPEAATTTRMAPL
jgi:hypothetical protein